MSMINMYDKEQIIKCHCQKYNNSCTASAIELVLKLLGEKPCNYYELQDEKGDVCRGFDQFDNRVIGKVRFEAKYNPPNRNNSIWHQQKDNFYRFIDSELENGKYVILSLSLLQFNGNYHTFIIYPPKANNEYNAIAIYRCNPIFQRISNVKEEIDRIYGTDIMIYNFMNAK